MLIHINIFIYDMVLYLILVYSFCFQVLIDAKLLFFFSVYHSSFFHIDNVKKHIFVLGECQAQELDDTTIKAEAKYSISFSISQKQFCLSIHYNGSSSFLFVNAKNINSLILFQSKKLKTKTTPTTFRKYFQKRFS